MLYRYKITSQERMLTNLAVEYEKLADPRLVKLPFVYGYVFMEDWELISKPLNNYSQLVVVKQENC